MGAKTSITATIFSITMKACLILLAALCASAFAANEIGRLVHMEVAALYKAEPHMTVDQCKDKCDAEFALVAGRDEAMLDRICAQECTCQKNNSCGQATHAHVSHHVTHAHHTRPAPTAA